MSLTQAEKKEEEKERSEVEGRDERKRQTEKREEKKQEKAGRDFHSQAPWRECGDSHNCDKQTGTGSDQDPQFLLKNMSPALLTVKTYKYLRENSLGKFFSKNITWSPVPPFCVKNFLREMMFMTSSLGDEEPPSTCSCP